ncbi:hypothetical protein ACXET9_15090 [Brachybacterium sp. DNPG3]
MNEPTPNETPTSEPASSESTPSEPATSEPTPPQPAPEGPVWTVPATAWIRPALMLIVGLALAALLAVAQLWAGAIMFALFALLMGYWTSPLRTGPHQPLVEAAARRGDEVAIVLWAPGDPLSARLHTAIRGDREDVAWVNVYKDPSGAALTEELGGRGQLPIVIVGQETAKRATVGRLLDMLAEGRDRAAAKGEADEDPTV